MSTRLKTKQERLILPVMALQRLVIVSLTRNTEYRERDYLVLLIVAYLNDLKVHANAQTIIRLTGYSVDNDHLIYATLNRLRDFGLVDRSVFGGAKVFRTTVKGMRFVRHFHSIMDSFMKELSARAGDSSEIEL